MVPARRERLEPCLATTAELGAGSLCVLVVNAGEQAEDVSGGERLLCELEERAPARWRCSGLSLHPLDGRALLAVECVRGERRFGARDGVGRARKLGADLVLALAERGALEHRWIHNTDADARLPARHCELGLRAARARRAVGCVAPFWHAPSGDAAVDAATAAYELELRYYVAGLRHAGSPWAFHTIGSTISLSCSAYAAVRGFPRREAGEDFYLLNKLAKLGPLVTRAGPPVEIRSRRSTRAPFGTGPAVESLLAGRPAQVYDPRVFERLAALERALAELAAGQGLDALERLARAEALRELERCLAAMRGLAQRYPDAQLARRIREAFDAFATLKLVHELTRTRWPKLAWARAVDAAPFLDFGPDLPPDEQRRRLAAREGLGADPRAG